MDLDFSEDQQLLRRTVRAFLEQNCDKVFVRAMETDGRGYSPDMWRRMADMGWLGLGLPEEYGGSGGSVLDLVILHEEMGRVLCPTPHQSTVVLCGTAISLAGSDEQKHELLTKIAEGKVIMAFALPETDGTWQADDVKTAAKQNGDGFFINGRKMFVHWAEQADKLLVVARTESKSDPREGISLFVVDTRSAGISYTPLLGTARDKQAEIVLENVFVPAKNQLGKLNEGWAVVEKALQWGLVASCAQMSGGCDRVLQMSTTYAKERVQFDHPIGSFQAIQHYLSDMATECTGVQTLVYRAAWTLDEGLPANKVVAMAKVQAGDSYRHVAAVGHQIHGGLGFTLEGEMELYSRRAKAMQLSMGPSLVWEEVVAQEIGL